jgi:hypothetical protein
MAQLKIKAVVISAVLMLGGCSVFEDLGDMVWPSDDEKSQPEVVQVPPPQPAPPQGAPQAQQQPMPQQAGQQPPPGYPPPPPGYQPPPGYPPPGYQPPPGQPMPPPGQPGAYPGAPPAPPPLGTTNFQPTPPSPGSPTGTYVGGKVVQLRQDLINMQAAISAHNTDLQQLRNTTVQHSQAYHGIVAAVSARLQVGTTPGNPVLVQQWNEAQSDLDRLDTDIAGMNSLETKVTADSAMSSFLLESVRAAYGLSGAVDEDHRQLAILEDETNRTVVLIDRLLNELSNDVRRQSEYVTRERGNLSTLSLAINNGELYGQSLSNRAFRNATPGPMGAAGQSFGVANRRPLVVIRFDRPKVEYEQALYSAVSQTLDRRPDASFDLVAVSATQGNAARAAINVTAARKNAESVLRALNSMGLPADRIALSAATSATATSNEVHLYVR